MTTFLLRRLAMAKSIDTVVLATSTHDSDEILANLAANEGFASFRGSEDDKLDRYFHAAVTHKLDAVIIVDGDDPFCFPEWIDNVAAALREGKDDCVYITGLPLGAASTGLTTDALRRVLELKDEQDTEVWGGYFIGSERFSARQIKVEDPLFMHPEIRLTVDYKEDYELVCRVIEALDNRSDFTSRELMEVIVKKRPEFASINRVAQVRYEKHIQKSAPVKFKEGAEIRALVIGLGSMGKRRVRNLGALGVTKVTGFDIRNDRREEVAKIYGIPVFDSFEQALRESCANLLIVCTPPDLHMQYAHQAFDLGLHCFIEASVVDVDGIADLAKKITDTGPVIVPSCTMRYYPGPRKVKELIAAGVIGRVLNVNYQTGQYLPDWHPWEAIGDYYVSRRDTGAAREIVPFELTWLNDIFGAPTPLACVRTKLTDMSADIDDIYHCILRYDSGVVLNMTVEVISRPVATREMRVIGSEGEIVFSADARNVRFINTTMSDWRVHPLENGTVETHYINPEEPYIAEIKDFLSAVQKNDSRMFPNSLDRDVTVLNTLYTLEKLSEVKS
jgi:predicted dehydrogenase/spore coat polysaccharide biosynthesis protein SpsF (cytidylyltransferase family)